MKMSQLSRNKFIKKISLAGIAFGNARYLSSLQGKTNTANKKRIGIIGLDTSHCIEFTKVLNSPDAGVEFAGYKVVVAYPKGSADIESSVSRIPGYTEEIKKYGVLIAGSVKELLDNVDVVLLETNDSRPQLEQALEVFKAGKPVFIDKPVAASLKDAIAIYEAAKHFQVPMFSSSSLRFITSAEEITRGNYGKVLGADVFGPAHLEKTHPDLFWYGIHGVELLFTLMGTGCKSVIRVNTPDTDVVVGTWEDQRIGNFRGLRSGKLDYGGTVYPEKVNVTSGSSQGYNALLVQIIKFFETGKSTVDSKDTIEIYAFMEAADESKRKDGMNVSIESVLQSTLTI
ncbi:MAG: Gfo/Idh/MocA family oxidoreductase [Ginsengibacter sp.]